MASDVVAEFMKRMNKDLAKKVKKGEQGLRITTGDDVQLASHVPFGLPSGIPQFDLAIGKPGYPAGRLVEFFGFEMSGKSTASLQAIASCQRLGGLAMYIDTECTFAEGRDRARKCGVSIENLQMPEEVDSLEKVFDCIDSFLVTLEAIEWKGPSIIVVDSITAVESEGNAGKELREESRVGQDARVLRKSLKRLTPKISKQKTCVIFVNHAISNIGGFGNNKTSAGGHAIKFWASLRVDFTFLAQIVKGAKGDDDRQYEGQKVQIAVRKNKVGRTASPEFEIPNLVNGFDMYSSLLEGFRYIGLVEVINQKSYHYKPTETTFQTKEWPALVQSLGGPDQLYDFFLEKAQELKKISPYGEDDVTEPVSISPVESVEEENEEK